MNFQLSCETYIRLCGITKQFSLHKTEEERASLRCVRLEHRNGSTYAIASNAKVAAIYHLGKTEHPDAFLHLNSDALLLEKCEAEKPFNSELFVTGLPELGIVSVKTTFGFSYPGSVGTFPAGSHLENWRTWSAPAEITKTKGAMAWNFEHMIALNASSPSGMISFPEFIDNTKPVILRDINFDNWVGVFMPNLISDNGVVKATEPARLPEWW